MAADIVLIKKIKTGVFGSNIRSSPVMAAAQEFLKTDPIMERVLEIEDRIKNWKTSK